MEIVAIIAAVAVLLLIVELALPTGGVLALIGAAGLVGAGVVALNQDSSASDYIGPGLITLGVLSIITFFVITPRIIRAHTDEPVRTGWEEMVGEIGEVRSTLNPDGQIWIDGALWRARLAGDDGRVEVGNRVRVESVDGLTLVVGPVSGRTETVERGE